MVQLIIQYCSLSTSSFFNAVFICAVYLFTLLECLKSSSLSSLRVKFRTIDTCLNLIVYISMLLLYVNHFWFYEIVLKLSDDIKENPIPRPSSNQIFSIFHWNQNNISAYNYLKISLLRAYISSHKFDVICIYETHLDSGTSDIHDSLKIADYN